MLVTDAYGREWLIPALTWDDLRRINKVIRDAAAELPLPRDQQGQPVWDLHHPQVQQWFHNWTPAAIIVATVLLGDQAKALKLDEIQFAAGWRGDPLDRLRDAIWQEFILYLPPSARGPAEELRKTLTAQRALQLQTAGKMLQLMETDGQLIVTQQIEALRRKIQTETRDVPIPQTMGSGSQDSLDSIRERGRSANSKRCTSPARTGNGTGPHGSPPPSEPPG